MICGKCWLVQTEDFVGREQLFSNSYAYFSSYSSSWLEHARRFVEMIVGRLELTDNSLVAEIAANDGYLLQFVQAAGIPCYGVEPASNTAAAARAKGIEIVDEFFGKAVAETLAAAGRKADLIVANNVLAHVPDINDFVCGIAMLLKDKGVASFEFPHLARMILETQFDTAYHEHYSYLSFTTTKRILETNGLSIFDVEQIPTHGGSLRVFSQRTTTGQRTTTAEVTRVLADEAGTGVSSPAFYSEFQRRAETIKNDFLQFLLDAKSKGLRVVGYGAAAKGNTLLNFAGVRPDLLAYVADKNPAKQGLFLPGSHIPVVSVEHLLGDRPDFIVILPWNLKQEIGTLLSTAREWGTKFVTAVPRLNIN